MPLKILIVDDHQLFIDGLSMLVKNIDDIEVIGGANNGNTAIEFCKNNLVNVVLMDVEMPEKDGISASEEIKKLFPHIKIIGVTMMKDYHTIKKALRSGMDGYVIKNLGIAELQKSIEQVMVGNIYTSPEIQTILMNGLAGRATHTTYHASLTTREKEITRLVLDGMTNEEIAPKLFLSVHTVNTHRKNILSKLSMKNTAMLAKYISEHPNILEE